MYYRRYSSTSGFCLLGAGSTDMAEGPQGVNEERRVGVKEFLVRTSALIVHV